MMRFSVIAFALAILLAVAAAVPALQTSVKHVDDTAPKPSVEPKPMSGSGSAAGAAGTGATAAAGAAGTGATATASAAGTGAPTAAGATGTTAPAATGSTSTTVPAAAGSDKTGKIIGGVAGGLIGLGILVAAGLALAAAAKKRSAEDEMETMVNQGGGGAPEAQPVAVHEGVDIVSQS
jgi:hypothetical protein